VDGRSQRFEVVVNTGKVSLVLLKKTDDIVGSAHEAAGIDGYGEDDDGAGEGENNPQECASENKFWHEWTSNWNLVEKGSSRKLGGAPEVADIFRKMAVRAADSEFICKMMDKRVGSWVRGQRSIEQALETLRRLTEKSNRLLLLVNKIVIVRGQ
jgi:hypothetical protein